MPHELPLGYGWHCQKSLTHPDHSDGGQIYAVSENIKNKLNEFVKSRICQIDNSSFSLFVVHPVSLDGIEPFAWSLFHQSLFCRNNLRLFDLSLGSSCTGLVYCTFILQYDRESSTLSIPLIPPEANFSILLLPLSDNFLSKSIIPREFSFSIRPVGSLLMFS